MWTLESATPAKFRTFNGLQHKIYDTDYIRYQLHYSDKKYLYEVVNKEKIIQPLDSLNFTSDSNE